MCFDPGNKIDTHLFYPHFHPGHKTVILDVLFLARFHSLVILFPDYKLTEDMLLTTRYQDSMCIASNNSI